MTVRFFITMVAALIFSAAVSIRAGAEPGADNEAASGSFSVLTYNIAGLPEPLSGSRPIQNTAHIGQGANAYDLALVQEDFAYHHLLMETARHPHSSASDKEGAVGDGLGRLSIFPFGTVTHYNWVECHGYLKGASDCWTEKGFSMATHEIAPGVEIDVYNLHMEAGNGPRDTAAKEANVEQLIGEIALRSEGRAIIVAGDFNLHKDKEEDAEMLAKFEESLGLSDACLALGECRDRIDRVYFRSGGGVELSALGYDVPHKDFLDAKGRDLSDHKPVSAVIGWSISR